MGTTGNTVTSELEAQKYPLRTQRKAETRRRIVASALRLAGREGAASITMAKVAKEADVHVTTLFTHFASKAELFADITEPAIFALTGRIQESKGYVPFFEFGRTIQKEFATMMSSKGRELVDQALHLRSQIELLPAWIHYEKTQVDLLAGYLEHDYAISEIDARLFAGMIVSSFVHSYELWLSDPEMHDLTEMSRINIEHIERIFSHAAVGEMN